MSVTHSKHLILLEKLQPLTQRLLICLHIPSMLTPENTVWLKDQIQLHTHTYTPSLLYHRQQCAAFHGLRPHSWEKMPASLTVAFVSGCPNPFRSITRASSQNKTRPWPQLKGSSHLPSSALFPHVFPEGGRKLNKSRIFFWGGGCPSPICLERGFKKIFFVCLTTENNWWLFKKKSHPGFFFFF